MAGGEVITCTRSRAIGRASPLHIGERRGPRLSIGMNVMTSPCIWSMLLEVSLARLHERVGSGQNIFSGHVSSVDSRCTVKKVFACRYCVNFVAGTVNFVEH